MPFKINIPRRISLTLFFGFAVIFFIASILVANWQISTHNERAEIKRNGQKTSAVVVSRQKVQFNSYEGLVTAKPIVQPLKGTLKRYDIIEVFYDKKDPTRVVLNQDDTAFNVTMWIVVVKLFGASIILAYFGYKKYKNQLALDITDEKIFSSSS